MSNHTPSADMSRRRVLAAIAAVPAAALLAGVLPRRSAAPAESAAPETTDRSPARWAAALAAARPGSGLPFC